ncbi:MAG TPA: outer membrane protein transport protein [Myxococcales bacterium]
MRNLAALAATLAPAAALAGGYVVPNLNARDLALAGSAVAAQDTAAATYANPAALSKLDGLNLSLDLSLVDFRSTWTDSQNVFNASPVSMIPKGAFPPALYAAYGLPLSSRVKLGLGAGLTIPGGGYVFWPGGWAGRNEIVTVDRKVYGAYLTAGIQVLRQLRLGGGLVYYRTTEHLVRGVNFLSQEGQIELGTAGGAASFDLSAEGTPFASLPLTLSVDYKHQGVQHLEGHAHGSNVPLPLRPGLLDQGVTHTLTYPNQLNLGAAFRAPLLPLLVTAGFTWERFHVYQEDAFVGDRGVSVVVPRDYRNGYTFRLGGEYQALPILKLRAGVLRDISPSRTDTLDPSLPDSNATAFSLGVGYAALRNLEIDAAYFHAFYDSITATGIEAFPGTYQTRASIYALNLVWKPGQERR